MPEEQYQEHWLAARAIALSNGHEIIEHGWEQHVIIDHAQAIVYRYPRHKAAAAKLADEVAVLATINQRQWNIKLPVMLSHSEICSSYKYVPGEVILHDSGHRLTDSQCQAIGADIGAFLIDFHALDRSIVDKKHTRQTTSLLEYYAERINSATDVAFYAQAKQHLNQLMTITNSSVQVVVHGDLHGPNIVLNPKTKQLNGVIDFSEIELGNPHQEFRKLFMTDRRILQSAVAAYHIDLNQNEILLWAYVNEWANLCHFAKTPDNLTYQRAYRHLSKWGQL